MTTLQATVSSLVCHAHVGMAVDCLQSLSRLCDTPVQFQIHDDGSLTPEDCEQLASIGEVRIVSRQEADDRMESELRRLPAARRFRTELPLALKLLDTVFFHPGPDYAFVDSDVLFLRPVTYPFRLDDRETNALFMEDREHSYSLRSWRMLTERQIRLPARVNTGVVCLRKSAYDPELLDWFLSRRSAHGVPWMREQTAWAVLGQRVGCRLFSPRQVRVMRTDENWDELVVGHFTARSRALLPEFVERSKLTVNGDGSGRPEPHIRLETVAAGHCGAWDLARYELRRTFGRLRMPRRSQLTTTGAGN